MLKNETPGGLPALSLMKSWVLKNEKYNIPLLHFILGILSPAGFLTNWLYSSSSMVYTSGSQHFLSDLL